MHNWREVWDVTHPFIEVITLVWQGGKWVKTIVTSIMAYETRLKTVEDRLSSHSKQIAEILLTLSNQKGTNP